MMVNCLLSLYSETEFSYIAWYFIHALVFFCVCMYVCCRCMVYLHTHLFLQLGQAVCPLLLAVRAGTAFALAVAAQLALWRRWRWRRGGGRVSAQTSGQRRRWHAGEGLVWHLGEAELKHILGKRSKGRMSKRLGKTKQTELESGTSGGNQITICPSKCNWKC